MKKIISLVLAVMLVLSALVCFSVSAADKKDPTFTADKSLITGKDDAGFYTNNFSSASKACNKTYSGDAVTIGLGNTPIALNGVAGTPDSKYVAIVGNYKVDANTPVKSVLISFNADATDIINELEIFACAETWKAVPKNNTPAETPSSIVMTPVAKIEKIQEKLVTSADGSFKYVELNLAAPVTAANYVIALSEASKVGLPEGTNTIHIAEIALFADAIPAPVDPTPVDPTPVDPAPATGDATVFAVAGLAVAAVIGTALVIRKKED